MGLVIVTILEMKMKRTSRYVFMMGSFVISWLSKKQPKVTLSSTEIEFIAFILHVLAKPFG